MKILSIDKYGMITFNADGSAYVDGWLFTVDDTGREPTTDELVLMLYEFLAENTRTRTLVRLSTAAATQYRVQ